MKAPEMTVTVAAMDFTLRDYFAVHAPDCWVHNNDQTVGDSMRIIGIKRPREYNHNRHYPQVIAIKSYQYADAMLAARVQNNPEGAPNE